MSPLYKVDSLRDYCMNPIGQFLNVLFEHLTVNHAEKQTGL